MTSEIVRTQNDIPVELKKGKWSQEEDLLLTSLVKTFNYKNWKLISQNIKGRTAIQCLHRWTKILQPGLVKGPWTAQEDAKLYEWVRTQGPTKWTLCSATIPGRSGKQCREHWNNSLNPEVKKGLWTVEEDFLIMVFYKKYNGSWKKISPLFEQRTENSIKNRFFSQLRKIASYHIQSKEKKFSSKIKLETLLNYLNEATNEAQAKFLKEKKMKESELENFLLQKEQKIINAELNNNSTLNQNIYHEQMKDLKTINKKTDNSIVCTSSKTNTFQQEEGDINNFENYDLEMLEKEIYEKCDNNKDIFNFDNEQIFESKLDNMLNTAFNDNIDTIINPNKDFECLMCHSHLNPNPPNLFNLMGSNSSNNEYVTLMNKLIELERKVQDTKKELKKFENNDENITNKLEFV